jgi:DNA topoisomerase
MKKLIICEKGSAARELQHSGFFGKLTSKDGYMENDQYIITWCQGHIYRKQDPSEINPIYGLKYSPQDKFDYELPSLASEVKHIPNIKKKYANDKDTMYPTRKKSLDAIKTCLKRKDYDEIILAADPDAEGERIHTDVIRYNKSLIRSGVTFSRFWNPLSYQNSSTVKTAFDGRQPAGEKKFRNLLKSAEARSMGDYLIGMKGTKLMTDHSGSMFRVGRVISVILGIVGRRELEIKNFIPKDYWNIKAQLGELSLNNFYYVEDVDDAGKEIKRRETRYFDISDVNQVFTDCEKVKLVGKVIKATKTTTKSQKPLPYHTDDFNSAFMSKYKVDMSISNACLEWLNKNGYVSYPRSNGNYYAKEDFATFAKMIKDCQQVFSKEIQDLAKDDKKFNDLKLEKTNQVFNSKKAEKQNHLPLGITKPLTKSDYQLFASHPMHNERKIKLKYLLEAYNMIATRCLIQVLPDDAVEKEQIVIDVNGHLFEANAEKVVYQGWKKFDKDASKGGNSELGLSLNEGDEVQLDALTKTASKTTPPKFYNKKTLLNSLMYIGSALSEEFNAITDEDKRKAKMTDYKKIKALITTSDGIGTQATREKCFEKLEKDDVVAFSGKNQEARLTANGWNQFYNLPEELKSIETTAIFEQYLSDIRTGDKTYEEFIDVVDDMTRKFVKEIKSKKLLKNDNIVKNKERKMGQPTAGMIKFAESLSAQHGKEYTDEMRDDFDKTKSFIDSLKDIKTLSEKTIAYAYKCLERNPDEAVKAALDSHDYGGENYLLVKRYLDGLKRGFTEKQWAVLTNPRNADKLTDEAQQLIATGATEFDNADFKVLDDCLKAIFSSFGKN